LSTNQTKCPETISRLTGAPGFQHEPVRGHSTGIHYSSDVLFAAATFSQTPFSLTTIKGTAGMIFF
jgi:hypothetical protein